MSSNGSGLAVREQGASLALSGSVRIDSLGEVWKLAEALSQARGFVPRSLLGDPNGIAAAILTGIELGLGPMEAMRSIHMVEGRPTMSADLMLARALRAGVRIEWERCDDQAAVLKLERNGMKHRQPFTKADAERAGLWGKNNWAKYPAAMLRARCVSAAMRAFCPDVLGSNVYTTEELDGSAPEAAPEMQASRVEVTSSVATETPAQVVYDEPSSDSVRTPETFDDCHEADELRAFCGDRRYRRLSNGRRTAAIAKCREAADRCGVLHEEALAWAGLGETEAAQ